jgi:hypothetical protein
MDEKFRAIFRGRIPHRQEILYVFGGIIFVIFSWSIRGFLYQIPALLLYYRLLDIISVLFYLLAFALFESLLILAGLILIGVILPRKWFLEGFAYKGFLSFLVASFAMTRLQDYLFLLDYSAPPMNIIYLGTAVVLIIIVALILLFQKVAWLQKTLLFLEERLQIFIYLYVPLGVIGVLVIVFRNLQ